MEYVRQRTPFKLVFLKSFVIVRDHSMLFVIILLT